MRDPKSRFILISALDALLLVSFAVASVLSNETVCNILSAACAGVAGATLFYSHILSEHKRTSGLPLPFYALACFSWFAADICWGVTFPGTAENILFCNYIYMLTNVFLAVAVLIYIGFLLKKWRSAQLLLDTLIISVIVVLFVWIAFFQKDHEWIDLFLQDGVSSAVCIALDILMAMGTLISIYFIRCKKYPAYILIFAMGILAFVTNDLYYYYVFAHHQYIPDSMLDVFYVFSLIVISLGGLWRELVSPEKDFTAETRFEISNRWLFLFLAPVVSLFVEGFVLEDTMSFLTMIVFYKVFSNQIQLANEKDKLYRREKEISTILEKRVQEQYGELLYMAQHDTVTKLYNRRYFNNSLENAMEEISESETVAVFMIDLDRFKTINDTLGHDIGDEVLIEMSARMQECGDIAVLARLGGDEFAIYLKGANTHEKIAEIAKELIKKCSPPICASDNKLYVTLSIGIAVYPNDADNRVALMRNADVAMYRAKSEGYNRFVFYDPFFSESTAKKHEIEALLREADIECDFELYYQPQFDLLANKLIGAEALLRWKNAKYGYIPPKEFIPVAEEIEYIVRLGKWVMNEAVRQIIQWNTSYSIDLKMGINISQKQLQADDFICIMKSLIKNDKFRSIWIDAEITEDCMLGADNSTDEVFGALKDLKISVSVDDFGSGYSSWGYLNKFPFDRIKIDQSLTEQLSRSNTNGIQVVKAIISMADSMGMKVIAEGVENEEQLEILKKLKCRQAQGYCLGRPVPAADFEEMFIKNSISS